MIVADELPSVVVLADRRRDEDAGHVPVAVRRPRDAERRLQSGSSMNTDCFELHRVALGLVLRERRRRSGAPGPAARPPATARCRRHRARACRRRERVTSERRMCRSPAGRTRSACRSVASKSLSPTSLVKRRSSLSNAQPKGSICFVSPSVSGSRILLTSLPVRVEDRPALAGAVLLFVSSRHEELAVGVRHRQAWPFTLFCVARDEHVISSVVRS